VQAEENPVVALLKNAEPSTATFVSNEETERLMEAFLAKQSEREDAENQIKTLSAQTEAMVSSGHASREQYYEAGHVMADAYQRVGQLLEEEISLLSSQYKAAIPDPEECQQQTEKALAGYEVVGNPQRYFEIAAAWRHKADELDP
jgi:hypothetical protein